jgi:predicted NAD/FAD-binding protein
MLSDLIRFYQDNKDVQLDQCNAELSIEDYLNQNDYSEVFRRTFISNVWCIVVKPSGSSWKYSL